jgi:hypothetical protein
MNKRGMPRHLFSITLIVCAVSALLLSACQPVSVSGDLPPAQAAASTQASATAQSAATALPTQPPSGESGDIVLDLSGVAHDQMIETVAAVPASADRPWWAAAPQYRRVTLRGYTVANHMLNPQIFVYPVEALAPANENAGKIAADLQAVLQTQQAGDRLPFLPLIDAQQIMHAQVQYLDFKNGKGVRFLTQYSQGMTPVNNSELFYTFQGLTSDGKYYIAGVLPVMHPELPATYEVGAPAGTKYSDYLTKTVTWLDQQPISSFTPDLAKLDALIQSIEVK